MPKMTLNDIETYATLEKTVTAANEKQGKVYVQKEWIGKKVLILLLDPLDDLTIHNR
jgi:putative transposon-encoded protein